MRTHAERPAHVRLLQEMLHVIQSESEFQTIVRMVLMAARRYSPQAVDVTERRLMRVAIARFLFYAAIDKGASRRTIERRFRETLSLPCGYLPSDVAVTVEFAVYCGREGRPAAGIRQLERLTAELDRRKNTVPRRMLAYCQVQVAQMLRRLRERK